MIIDDFNVVSVPSAPYEAQPILIVDANAVLAFPVPRQRFQTVSRWPKQIRKTLDGIKHRNLLQRRSTNVRRDAPALAGFPQHLRIGVREAPDHSNIITHFVKNGKRYGAEIWPAGFSTASSSSACSLSTAILRRLTCSNCAQTRPTGTMLRKVTASSVAAQAAEASGAAP